MRAVVIYESMYGNTHVVADRIAEGLRAVAEVAVVPVTRAAGALVEGADLVVVGGPTHVGGMTTPRSRTAAASGDHPQLDPDAEGPGLREWFDQLAVAPGTKAAAFDTRVAGPAFLSGRASRGIAHRLTGHGFELVAPPESFVVDRTSHLIEGVAEAATQWGAELGELASVSR
jgi:hypothetical protein